MPGRSNPATLTCTYPSECRSFTSTLDGLSSPRGAHLLDVALLIVEAIKQYAVCATDESIKTSSSASPMKCFTVKLSSIQCCSFTWPPRRLCNPHAVVTG